MAGKEPLPGAAVYLPAIRDLEHMAEAVQHCRGCELYKTATQAVFGEGPADAKLMFIGEKTGDVEDREGRPFVGPAGKLLDRALEAVGIDRSGAYLTNAVKHFKWIARGKRRMHAKPTAREIAACRPWLEAQIAAIHPRLIVLLGATAAQTMLGAGFRVLQHRGQIIRSGAYGDMLVTVHPSSVLHMPDEVRRHAALAEFIDDLRVIVRYLEEQK